MFASALLCQVLLATAAFAIPTSRGRLAERVARRAERAHLSRPKRPSVAGFVTEVDSTSNATHTDFSGNWAGAVLISDSNTYKSVTGTFTVPIPHEPSGGSGFHSASAWVGIDGDTCDNAILQTGVDFTVISGDEITFDAWYEWFPSGSVDFEDFNVYPGDTITATVTATSTTSGTATLINHSTGRWVSHSFSDQPALCEQNAEWVVEDYQEGSEPVPLANWGTVTFTDASAGTSSGTVGLSGATIIDMEQNGKVVTSVSVSDCSVSVEYTGS
ncbi:aspergillopepsin [Trametes punicea]|nr:aspergillopepsin [Trametes punicea]